MTRRVRSQRDGPCHEQTSSFDLHLDLRSGSNRNLHLDLVLIVKLVTIVNRPKMVMEELHEWTTSSNKAVSLTLGKSTFSLLAPLSSYRSGPPVSHTQLTRSYNRIALKYSPIRTRRSRRDRRRPRSPRSPPLPTDVHLPDLWGKGDDLRVQGPADRGQHGFGVSQAVFECHL